MLWRRHVSSSRTIGWVSRDGFHTRTIATAMPLSTTVITAAIKRNKLSDVPRGPSAGSGSRKGRVDSTMACHGLIATAHVWQEIPSQASPNTPVSTVVQTASHKTSTSTVMANA